MHTYIDTGVSQVVPHVITFEVFSFLTVLMTVVKSFEQTRTKE